jgi:hypothetical protein
MSKTFKSELIKIFNTLSEAKNFTLTRFGDGEAKIIFNQSYDYTKKFHGEWAYDSKNKYHNSIRIHLIESLQYTSKEYFIGLPAHMDDNSFFKLKNISGQNESNLTFASIFADANYQNFKDLILPQFKNKKIVLVVNKNSNISLLPFTPIKTFFVGVNAWVNNFSIIEEIKEFINLNNIEDTVFLFAAGPLSNILCHKLHRIRPNNTYINIGSSLDIELGLGGTRHYLRGHECLNYEHIWR